MRIEKRSAHFGAALLIFALLLRLAVALITHQVQAGHSAYLEAEPFLPHRPNGGVSIATRLPSSSTAPPGTTIPTISTTTPTLPTIPTTPPLPQQPPAITFSPEDLQLVDLRYGSDCGYRVDAQTLLMQALDWQLDTGEPTVLIVHSHATESYTRQDGEYYIESAAYRTTDTAYNMVAVGDFLATQLQALGIEVLHDRQVHDYPAYNAAYTNSRKSVAQYLEEYPSIRLVLDLHRDAALNADGSQYATSATVDGEKAAQIMLLAGTDWLGGSHPHWESNLSLALKLQVLLEQKNPGITRRTLLRGSIFNQDLCPGMLIVEVGTAGNTLHHALRAIPPLANAIAELANGANCV